MIATTLKISVLVLSVTVWSAWALSVEVLPPGAGRVGGTGTMRNIDPVKHQIIVNVHKDYSRAYQPFNGKGISGRFLPNTNRTLPGKPGQPGQGPRSDMWRQKLAQVYVDSKAVRVITTRPLPPPVEKLMDEDILSADLLDSATVQTLVRTIKDPTVVVVPPGTGGAVDGNNPREAPTGPATVPSTGPAGWPTDPTIVLPGPGGVVLPGPGGGGLVIGKGGVVIGQSARRGHARVRTQANDCNVQADFTSDSTGGYMLLSFAGFSAWTDGTSYHRTLNCAFRVPLVVPSGFSVAALKTRFTGSAHTSRLGTVSASTAATIGLDALGDKEWADYIGASSYDIFYLGPDNDDQSFAQIIDFGQVNTTAPTYSPCGAPGTAAQTPQTVYLDFHFVMTARRDPSEINRQDSRISLDSTDITRTINVQLPLDFQLC